MTQIQTPAIWFPAVRTETGTDIFTKRLVEDLKKEGIRAEINWLPRRTEYAPWTVPITKPPEWANIIHINTWLHSRFLPKNLPVVATLHHSIHDPALRPYKGWMRTIYHRWWMAPNERRVLRRANHVTAVSQFVADMAKQTLCDVPMQVIYNGIDTDTFCPGNRVRQPNEPFRLLYVGSWMSRKGVDLLAPIMRELGDGYELYYTGGPEAEKDKKDMPGNMHDLGRLNQKEVIKAMQVSDAFLFPSRSEGLPLSAIEAMSCGLPVIGMQKTALEEVIKEGINGYICYYNDHKDFAKKIKQHFQCNKETFSSATQYAKKKFDQNKTTEEFITAYKKALERET